MKAVIASLDSLTLCFLGSSLCKYVAFDAALHLSIGTLYTAPLYTAREEVRLWGQLLSQCGSGGSAAPPCGQSSPQLSLVCRQPRLL